MPGVLREQTNEPSREEIHHNRARGPSRHLRLQEVLALLVGLPDCLPYGSRFAKVSGEQTGSIWFNSKMDTPTIKVIFIKMRQNHNFEIQKIERQCFQESIIIPLNSTWSNSHLRQR